MRDDTGSGYQTMFMCSGIEGAEQSAALSVSASLVRVRRYGMHLRQVDNDTVIATGFAGPAVATAPNRSQQGAFTSESHSIAHVFTAHTARDQRRMFVVHAVPELAGAVVLRVSGQDHGPCQRVAKLFDNGFLEFYLDAVERNAANAGVGRRCDGRLPFTARQQWNRSRHAGRHCRTTELTSVHI